MNSSPFSYLMDDPREAARLAEKVNAQEWLHNYFTPHLQGARRVLDVGCGPAVIAAEIARAHPEAEVCGIDGSHSRIEEAQRNLGKLSNGSAQAADARKLPFESNRFDFAYSRFLLEYLAEPNNAVDEMARVCRPGGRVLLQDLDGQLVWHHPVDQELQSDIELTLSHLAKTGFDPFIGRKLFSLALGAGLINVSVRIDPYHLFAGRIDDQSFRLWELKLDIALPAVARALGSDDAARKLKARFLDYLRREDTLTYSILFTVSGIKPYSSEPSS